VNYLFDTNAVIYFLEGKGNYPAFSDKDFISISCITEIELLSGNISNEEKKRIQSFISMVRNLLLDKSIIQRTIDLRKDYKLKIPDAIIIATAIESGATIITADKAVIQKLKNYNIYNPLK
jgi:predicted nucleic acid-binding protein